MKNLTPSECKLINGGGIIPWWLEPLKDYFFGDDSDDNDGTI